jgi:hypothetical protein
MFARKDGRVYFDLSEREFERLLLFLGMAAGANDGELAYEVTRLANVINEGNPDWIPYNVPKNSPPDGKT